MYYEKRIWYYSVGVFDGFSVFLDVDPDPCSRKDNETQTFSDVASATPLDEDVRSVGQGC
jgi:hypothetical protein